VRALVSQAEVHASAPLTSYSAQAEGQFTATVEQTNAPATGELVAHSRALETCPKGAAATALAGALLGRAESVAMSAAVKFNLSTKEAVAAFGSVALFRRLRHHRWIKPVMASRPGRTALYPVRQLEKAQARLEAGELPPPLPCEAKAAGMEGAAHAN